MKNQIKIGAILSYINIGLGNVIPLVYTPIMLSLLGQSEYGLYKIACSAISYLSLMSLGIGSAVTRYLIKSRTDGGKEGESKTFALFNVIFNIIAVLTLVVGFLLIFLIPNIYNESLGFEDVKKMQILVSILVINTAISFSSTAYTAIVSTHEKFLFIQIVNILSSVLLPIVNLIMLWFGFGSIGLTVASLISTVTIKVLYTLYVRNNLKISPDYKNPPKDIIPEILKFSAWVLLGSIASKLFNSTDTLIIGAIPALSSIGAAIYNIGLTFPNIIFSLAQVVPGLFTPKVNKMVFAGESDCKISDLVISVGRYQTFIVALITSGFIAFGKPFIDFYAGNEYADAYWVAIVIMIPNCIPLIQSVALSVSQAKNLHKFRSIVYIIIAIINLISTIIFVNRYGIIGAAICTGVSYLIGHGFIMNIYYFKKVNIDIPRFWKETIPTFFIAIILCITTLLISKYVDFYNIKYFILGVIFYSLVYICLVFIFILNKNEKKLVYTYINKIKKKQKNQVIK